MSDSYSAPSNWLVYTFSSKLNETLILALNFLILNFRYKIFKYRLVFSTLKLTSGQILIRSRKLLSKYTQKTLQTAFLVHENIIKVKQLYNLCSLCSEENRASRSAGGKISLRNWSFSQANNGFCGNIESWWNFDFFFFVEPNTKVNAKNYCNELLKKMTPEMNRLAKHIENLFIQDGAWAHAAKLTLEMLKNKKQLRLLEPHHWPPIVQIWI